jgi:hypothetical protein
LRILIRTSKLAIWARRLGSVAVPLVVISVLLHRFRLIGGDVFLAAAALAFCVALVAVLTSLAALVRLWHTGDQGWSKALLGLALGILCLLPFAYFGSLALRYPPVTDIATTDRSLLPLVFEPGTADMPPPKVLSAAEQDAIFPNIVTRSYPLNQTQTFELIREQVEDNGWEIRAERAVSLDTVGQINAQIVTWPGWREEVVIRITGDDQSAVVDMRSVSLNAPHDFGSNGIRLESFLTNLDDTITTLLVENPDINLPVPVEPEGEVQPPTS